jgi:hypothetical protein
MKTKTVERLMAETPEDVKKQVSRYADGLVMGKKEIIETLGYWIVLDGNKGDIINLGIDVLIDRGRVLAHLPKGEFPIMDKVPLLVESDLDNYTKTTLKFEDAYD